MPSNPWSFGCVRVAVRPLGPSALGSAVKSGRLVCSADRPETKKATAQKATAKKATPQKATAQEEVIVARHNTVDRIERGAAAAPYQDGILELFAAALFLGVALLWQGDRGAFIPFLALGVVFGAGGAVAWVKNKITYPRVGYAEPRAPGESPWGGVAFLAVGLGVVVAVIAGTGGLTSADSWRRWAPFLAGLLSSGGFWYAAASSGLWRYRVLATYSIALGFIVSLVSDGSSYRPVATYAIGMAAVLAGVGIFTLVRFLRRHPRAGPMVAP